MSDRWWQEPLSPEAMAWLQNKFRLLEERGQRMNDADIRRATEEE